MLSELRSLIPDENLCAKVLALLEAELEKREAQHKELEETLQHTIETLHGEVREKLRLQEEFRRNTEQKFHIAAELAGEYIYEATVDDGKIRALYVSPEFTHLTGYGIDEINAGNGWLDFIYPDDLPTVRSAVANILSGKPAKTEYRVRCKDGRTLWIRDFSQPFLDEQGRYVKSIGVSRNITAEKEAELALRREQQLLDALFNTVPLGICLSDEEGTFLRINRELSNILGYEAADLLGKHFSFVLAEEYRELAKEAHQTFMAGDSLITSGEWPIQRKDGERRWVQIIARKFQREDGRWVRVTAARDITREREQEKERAHLLELLARTEALAHIGSWEFDFKTARFTKWSDELFRIHERPMELGLPDVEEYRKRYILPEADERLRAWCDKLIQTGQNGEIEIPIITHLGNRKIIRIRGYLTFQNSVPIGAQGMTQDITREKMLEKQKEELTAQLMHSQKMEAIGTLTGGIAHEFNNILGGMLGNLRLLEKKFGHEPTVKKYTDRLISLNQRATTIVSQMLGFARKGKYQPQPLSLKMCVSNVLQILAPSTDRRIRFHIESKSNVPLIYADPTQIEQVILNLAKNAVDAIEPLLGKERDTGHITFRLSFEAIAERFGSGLQAEMRNMPMVLLEVRDNGTGIPPELQSRIFEPFFTTKPVGQGTGLGLPMVYGIVENHGGHLFLESEVGKGTSFFLYFPAVCSAMSSTHTNSDELEKKLSLTGAHVLVIDDEAIVRETLAEYLSELGATVEVAESGEKGLERFYALPKENLVVVLDLNLPDISGVQVLEALRAAESRVKVIIGTGYAGNGHAEELQALGAKQILTKPYRLEEVAMQIAELVPLSSRLEGCEPQKRGESSNSVLEKEQESL